MSRTLEIVSKELRRRRVSTLAVFCAVSLGLLLLACFVPRQYSATAELLLDAANPLHDELRERLRTDLLAGGPAERVSVDLKGSRLSVSYTDATPEASFNALTALLARLVSAEIARLQSDMRSAEATLSAELDAADQRIRAARERLDEAIAALPEGGESALGARIGQLQGELDALVLDIRASTELRASLSQQLQQTRDAIATMQSQRDAHFAGAEQLQALRETLALERAKAQPNAVALARLQADVAAAEATQARLGKELAAAAGSIDTVLQPRETQLQTRFTALRDELAAKERRRAEISRLLQEARSRSSSMQQESQQIRELQREYEDAAAMKRQIDVRLQQLQLDMVMRANPAALPFSTARVPVMPSRPDGIPAIVYVLAAMLGGFIVTLLRLVGGMMLDDRVRLADTVIADIEVPVLAVIPDYRPVEAVGRVRLPVVGVVLLAASTLAMMVLFLAVFG